MKNENAYSTYRRKNMEEKKYSKEKNQILHLQERKRNKEINIIKKSLILLIQEKQTSKENSEKTTNSYKRTKGQFRKILPKKKKGKK